MQKFPWAHRLNMELGYMSPLNLRFEKFILERDVYLGIYGDTYTIGYRISLTIYIRVTHLDGRIMIFIKLLQCPEREREGKLLQKEGVPSDGKDLFRKRTNRYSFN
ncbi:hypothetical protein TNIN_77191 [Trichonephila inaurata madagascariensis]|uniref:Uncharacterized protein n=1 Tax=Trichonephila inaurata madagascariensis TaxID=2747483 RepID=A0A8X7CCU6_9ARAC|nr:hypothetical protein TNIN_77191 [Trichonephila inaurata madagascariensis]